MRALSILLVEDSPSDVRLIREALKGTSVPVNIHVARDGVEAMDYLRDSTIGLNPKPDLILLDLNLPRKNGREVLSEIKADPDLRRIPVVVMTTSKAQQDITKAYTLNANCYISKPIELEDFLGVVHSIEDFWLTKATLPGK